MFLPKKTYCTIIENIAIAFFAIFILFTSCNNTNNKNIISKNKQFIDNILLAANLLTTQNAELAISYIDSATTNKNLTLQDKIRILSFKSFLYDKYLNNTEMSIIYADSMHTLLIDKNQQDYLPEFISAYYTKGDILFRQNKFGEAYPYYYQAKRLGSVYLDSCALGEYSYRIARVLYTQERYKSSKNNFLEALPRWKACTMDFGRYYRIQEIMNNIGLCYNKLANNDSALYYYKFALDFIDENKNKFIQRENKHQEAKGVIYGNIGDVFNDRKQYDSAKFYYQKNVAINLKDNYEVQDGLLSYLKIANLYLMQNKLDSMKLVLQNAETWLSKINFPRGDVFWLKLMWQYNDVKGNIKEAYKYLSLYDERSYEFSNSIKHINKVDIDKQIDFVENQHQIQLLENENIANHKYIKATVTIAILVFILFLTILLFWFRSKKALRKIKQLYATIQAQNSILEKALEESEEKTREKEKIVHIVAHDLRTPVASISSLTDMIIEEKDEKSKNELLYVIKEACNNAISLISDILKSSATSSDALTKCDVPINECLLSCASFLHATAAEKNQLLKTELLINDVVVNLDKDKMKRVFYNLVVNAIKFSYPNSVIKIKAQIKNQSLIISIQDAGIGIPANLHQDIFKANSKAKREGTNGEPSYGLGLSICKQIVEAHQGKIWVESEENKGSTFYMELPIQ